MWDAASIAGVVGGIIGLLSLVWKTVHTFVSTKFKTPQDVIAEKELEERLNSTAFERLKGMLEASESRHKEEIEGLKSKSEEREKEWNEKFQELNIRLEEVRTFNNELVKFAYVCINIIREADLMNKLPKPGPNGIYY